MDNFELETASQKSGRSADTEANCDQMSTVDSSPVDENVSSASSADGQFTVSSAADGQLTMSSSVVSSDSPTGVSSAVKSTDSSNLTTIVGEQGLIAGSEQGANDDCARLSSDQLVSSPGDVVSQSGEAGKIAIVAKESAMNSVVCDNILETPVLPVGTMPITEHVTDSQQSKETARWRRRRRVIDDIIDASEADEFTTSTSLPTITAADCGSHEGSRSTLEDIQVVSLFFHSIDLSVCFLVKVQQLVFF